MKIFIVKLSTGKFNLFSKSNSIKEYFCTERDAEYYINTLLSDLNNYENEEGKIESTGGGKYKINYSDNLYKLKLSVREVIDKDNDIIQAARRDMEAVI